MKNPSFEKLLSAKREKKSLLFWSYKTSHFFLFLFFFFFFWKEGTYETLTSWKAWKIKKTYMVRMKDKDLKMSGYLFWFDSMKPAFWSSMLLAPWWCLSSPLAWLCCVASPLWQCLRQGRSSPQWEPTTWRCSQFPTLLSAAPRDEAGHSWPRDGQPPPEGQAGLLSCPSQTDGHSQTPTRQNYSPTR